MKKFIKSVALCICAAMLIGLSGCTKEVPVKTENKTRTPVEGKIGKYGTPYEVGDIVFNDGSATPYLELLNRSGLDEETNKPYTQKEKDNIVAIIFYVGTELNNPDVNGNDDIKTVRTLGIGFKQNISSWNTDNAKANDALIEGIECKVTEENNSYKFSGIKNGSKNFEITKEWVKINYPDDVDCDEKRSDFEGRYPAFKWVTNYYSNAINLLKEYRYNWYIPSIAELYKVYEKENLINSILNYFEVEMKLSGGYYSSSQLIGTGDEYFQLWSLSMRDGNIYLEFKDQGAGYYCAIREF